VPPKKHIIIIGVLCVISLGLGYWYGMPKEEGSSGGGGKNDGGKKEPAFLKEGLVAYYPFNGNAKDESGNGNDGEVKGATLTTDRHGKAERAYDFHGKSFIFIKQNESQSLSKDIALSVWIKLKSSLPWQRIVQKSNGSKGVGYGIFVGAGNKIAFSPILKNGAVANNKYFVGGKFIRDKWQHVVLVAKDGDVCMSYIDGHPKSMSVGGHDMRGSLGFDLFVGVRGDKSHYFNGTIDDYRIHDRALSEAEVKALYEFEKPKARQASTRQLTLEEKKVVGVYTRKNRAGGIYKRVFLDNGVIEYYTDGKIRTDIPDSKWEIVDGELHMTSTTFPATTIDAARINNDGSFTFVAHIKDGERIQKQTITAEDTYKKIK
jgi:hypothetical protein